MINTRRGAIATSKTKKRIVQDDDEALQENASWNAPNSKALLGQMTGSAKPPSRKVKVVKNEIQDADAVELPSLQDNNPHQSAPQATTNPSQSASSKVLPAAPPETAQSGTFKVAPVPEPAALGPAAKVAPLPNNSRMTVQALISL